MLSISLLFLIGLMVVLVAASTMFYLHVYTKKINRRLQEGPAGNRKELWSPFRFCLTSAAVTVLILVVLLLILVAVSDSRNSNSNDNAATTNCNFYTKEEIEGISWLSNYSMEENAGYTRHEAQDENFRYTCFISEEPYDDMHPGFLVFIEYIGAAELSDFETTCLYGEFRFASRPGASGLGAGGGTVDSVVCFTGNAAQFEGRFTGTYGLFTEKDFEQYQTEYEKAFKQDTIVDELDYASVTAQFTIDFDYLFGTDEMEEENAIFAIN